MNAEERGVFRELLDELWLRNDVVPNDARLFERLAGSAETWARVQERVLAQFYETPEGLRNVTHDEVSSESRKRAEKQARYRERLRNKAGNVTGNDDGNE